MFGVRAVAAQLDPLSTPLEQRLNLSLAALMLLLLVGTAAYASTGRPTSRVLIAPERIPAWARPGAALTFVLAALAVLLSLLVVVGLFDDSQSLVDHVSSATTAVYLGLGLRVQWAAASGRMPTRVPVVAPTARLRIAVLVAAVAIGVAVASAGVAAPFVVRRDHEVARCRSDDLIHLDAQRALGSLRGEALQQEIEELAKKLEGCSRAGTR